MRQTSVPNNGPKLKLIEAAERLFAEHGFDAVSVRDVTQAAGGNVAAVNYHFGSREGLVQLVMSRHAGPVTASRLARFEELESRSAGAVSLADLLDAMISPVTDHLGGLALSRPLA